MRRILIPLILLVSVCPARPSGGIWCDVDDTSVKFHVGAGVTTGMGGPTFNFGGDLEVRGEAIAADLRKTVFEDSDLTQYWLDDKELRLLVHHEQEMPQTYASFELTILTKAVDEGVYDGTYALAVYDGRIGGEYKPVNFGGNVSCGAE